MGEVGGGVTCLWMQDAHVGGHGAVLGVQELVPALTVRQDACLQHPLPPAWFRPPVAALPPPPILGCLLPLQPFKRSPLAAPLGASGPWGASRPVPARSGVLEPSSPAS